MVIDDLVRDLPEQFKDKKGYTAFWTLLPGRWRKFPQ